MTILVVVGARPNFMRMAPLVRALSERGLQVEIVHAGKIYDEEIARVFFIELGLPEPDLNLGGGTGTSAERTAGVMVPFESVCLARKPDLVLVGGDADATMAVTAVAAKLGIPVGHVDSGLRSFDRSMPEEINRVIIDHLADLLFVGDQRGMDNLAAEGIDSAKVHFVGNTMVDTLLEARDRAIAGAPWERFGLRPAAYGLVALHQPSNIDDPKALRNTAEILEAVSQQVALVFPVNSRSRARLEAAGLTPSLHVRFVDPLPFTTFIGLMAQSVFVLTDFRGIEEETTILGVPCLTMRTSTERPSTIEAGTNQIVGLDQERILECVDRIMVADWPAGRRPPLWDGQAAGRIADVVKGFLRRG